MVDEIMKAMMILMGTGCTIVVLLLVWRKEKRRGGNDN